MVAYEEYIKLTVALIAIIDVPGTIPLFLQQTAKMSAAGRFLCALSAAIATFVVLAVFMFFGEQVLSAFGITIAAFKIVGGLVVLLIALELLGLTELPALAEEGGAKTISPITVGVFPIAVPMSAGPGAIVAVMVYAHKDSHAGESVIGHDAIVLAVIATAAAFVFVGLGLAAFAGRFIGPTAQSVMKRLLGMVVGALGMEFILEGLAEFFPALGAG